MRASRRLVGALITLSITFVGCGGSDSATVAESRPIAETDAVEAIAHSLDGVKSVHTVVELVAFVGDASATIARSETWADFESSRARTELSEPEAPGSDTVTVTEETVVVDGSGYRRSEDSDWADVEVDIASMVLTGIDANGQDFVTSLTEFAQGGPANWTVATNEDGLATYRRGGDVNVDDLVVEIGATGALRSITLKQRPTGVDASDPRSFETRISFDGVGHTVVDVPSDLPR